MDRPLLLDSTISTEELHSHLEEAIAQHQVPTPSLNVNSQQNATLPISCLPPEILCRIFSIVKAEVLFVYTNRSVQPPKCLKWIDITYVCSYWRQVALNAAYLWADLPLGNARWVEEMLRRSRDLGLVVEVQYPGYFSLSNGDMTKGLELAMQHSSRIKHLDVLNIPPASPWNDLQKALQKAAPQLEYLSVDSKRGPSFIELYHPPLIFSEEVFCEMEHLRHLELVGCSQNWSLRPPLLPCLTHLILRELSRDCRPTGKQLVDVLKGMPVLHLLHLRKAFPVEQVWNVDQIHLASLQNLHIASVHSEVEAFFRYVTFPPIATVKIQTENEDVHTDMSGVITNVSQSYSSPMLNITFRNVICLPYAKLLDHGIRFQLFNDPATDKQIIRWSTGVKLELGFEQMTEFTHAPPNRLMSDVTTNFFNSALLPQNVIIHMNLTTMGEKLSIQTLANVFGILPQVRSVVVNRYSCYRFFEALGIGLYSQETGFIDSAEKLYFPNVSSIYFQGMNLSESGIQWLKDCLIRRSECGARVDKLYFDGWCKNVHKSNIDSLLQVVDEVYWDLEKY